ncbi:MAG: gliding motility-associated ABC transporter permease subunit GldF [Bacteroidetes bacterium GWC2_33_15]|nr:MAG: gliding motility-associated ABC transporter permease subunit GldF [Bacteroidetes bacterium GWA2_33_15]OFX51027.1 MAG: gliding motility-associated ABC transporter permease subunit GldF [Bacteroidetes bacterium GWC2_33_15]OFX65650.1 MAG: gliding motility-associated ABC transporter permease subunit GldF [Bacteroidetes bacterium GWB2_32_14]OFX70235.1 MAG: gliding motility-associated ABC transporter permease subunit GldF [Bacteroidetes bacterium GWD2_33_33]HAN17231.1 gliding motility-associa
MYSLLKKEISSFFSTITGYVVIVIFLIVNSLFMWIFPGAYNIFDSGYASLDTLFSIAPWVFLFLAPAVTMRVFADEKKSGTIELLLTRPLSDFQIIFAKYLAALVLVLFSLIPTLIYFYSVYQLGNPVGNIDMGGTWGSFIGLFFLASIYVAIGILSSSITDNQIIAFIIGMLLCFLIYIGFDFASQLQLFKSVNSLIINLGINEHYKSMSRGVIDSRDIIYFISVIAFFLLITKTILQSRRW